MTWPSMNAAVEAGLLHDAISERRSGDHNADYRPWPPEEIPDGFGTVKLGDTIERGTVEWEWTDERRRRFDQFSAKLPIDPLGEERSTYITTASDGTVEQLAATFSTRGWMPPAPEGFKPYERHLIDLYGEPDDYGELSWSAYAEFEPMVW
ncbi:MAG: hypothetical protein ABEK29_08025, partial [Bradymonadaceae bacterium]